MLKARVRYGYSEESKSKLVFSTGIIIIKYINILPRCLISSRSFMDLTQDYWAPMLNEWDGFPLRLSMVGKTLE